ncbi:MAG: hypothetical protein WBA74_25300 [Cyclobacteriaceae bacterium]
MARTLKELSLMLPEKPAPIGFYVHTHGLGHAMRVTSIINHLENPATVFSSFEAPWHNFPEGATYVKLPSEDLADAAYKQPQQTPEHYHYLPLGVNRVGERYAIMADWIAKEQPAMMFVDVSVEVAQMVRLCSVPVAIPRMHGRRNDKAHLAAYEVASLLIAPFPEWAEQDDTADWIKEKTVYTGALCRFYDQKPDDQNPHDKPFVLIMTGGCHDEIDMEKINSWADSHPELDWIIVGNYSEVMVPDLELSDNIIRKKYVRQVAGYIKHAKYVVAPCSDNIASEIAYYGKPWICIPFERPFDEQNCKAEIFERENIAVVSTDWPNSSMITYLLHKADTLDIEKQKQLVNPLSAKAIASAIDTFIRMNRIEAAV